jgi:hypothetical protein
MAKPTFAGKRPSISASPCFRAFRVIGQYSNVREAITRGFSLPSETAEALIQNASPAGSKTICFQAAWRPSVLAAVAFIESFGQWLALESPESAYFHSEQEASAWAKEQDRQCLAQGGPARPWLIVREQAADPGFRVH